MPQPLADRVPKHSAWFGYYEAGHIMHIRLSAHAALKKDVAAFLRSASSHGRQPVG